MAAILCPNCSTLIPAEDVNVADGVALCRSCDQISKLIDIADADDRSSMDRVDIGLPPSGCTLHNDGIQIIITATARAPGKAVATLLAALFWNGIVSIFVLIALAETLQHARGHIPAWIPAPIAGSGNGFGMSLGMVIFLWIFLLPFLAIGLMLAATFLTHLFGSCTVTVRHSEGRISTGFGPFRWRRKFNASAVNKVRPGETTWSHNQRTQPCIVIETLAKNYRLASVLRTDRRVWMVAALRRTLLHS